MSDNRSINTGGGNYNESIQGNYIQGNYIDNSSNVNQFLEIITRIEQDVMQLEAQGYNSELAQNKVATDLAVKAQGDSSVKQKLITLGQYLSEEAANGVIGQAAVKVVSIALNLLGLPAF